MLSSLFTGIKKKFDPDAPIHPPAGSSSTANTQDDGDGGQPTSLAKPNKPIQTSYVFNEVPIPPDFLTVDAPDLKPLTVTHIDWPKTKIPEYDGYFAVVLDNVISPSECATLLSLAEASVPESHKTPTPSGKDKGDVLSSWGPALVNMGMGFEVLLPHYRNSDRIIWDQQEVVDRLWERCLRAEGLKDQLSVIENQPKVTGTERNKTLAGARWEFKQVNKRMRFLKYGRGQFFKRTSTFFPPLNLVPLLAVCPFSYKYTRITCLPHLPDITIVKYDWLQYHTPYRTDIKNSTLRLSLRRILPRRQDPQDAFHNSSLPERLPAGSWQVSRSHRWGDFIPLP